MRIRDIMNMDINDFNRLKKGELKDAINSMRSAIRKRIKRFEEAGFSIDDLSVYDKTLKDPLSVRGKNLNQLRHEFMRARRVLQSPTGSLRQYQKVRADSMNKLEREGVNVSPEQYDNFWKAYNRLSKTDKGSGAKANKQFKYNLLREISNYMNGDDIDFEQVASRIYNELDEIYESTMESGRNTDTISQGLAF